MRLFNFLRREPQVAEIMTATAAKEAEADRSNMFSLEDTTRLHQLFTVAREERDASWTRIFFEACWNASVYLPNPPYFTGPDGLPYYRLNLPQPGMRFEAHCLAGIARTCVQRNAGAAFFLNGDDPAQASQWVISMGEIDSLIRFGRPDGDPADIAEASLADQNVEIEQLSATHQSIRITEAHQVLVGAPSPAFLPDYSARALHRLMTRLWGVAEPRVALLVDPHLRPTRNLVIGLRRSEFADEEEASFEMSRVAWMLPPGRGVMLMPDDWTLGQMTQLTDLF